jgi:hypothetical protein
MSAPRKRSAEALADDRRRSYAREMRDLGFEEEEAVVDATLLLIVAYKASDPFHVAPSIEELHRRISGRTKRDGAKRRARESRAREVASRD